MNKLVLLLLVLLFLQTCVLAELTAEQCAVVYNKNSEVSEAIARHYARVRDVPEDQLFGLGIRYQEQISRETYENDVAPKIHDWLTSHENGSRIRCMVTCYDLPLKIDAHRPTAADKARAKELKRKLADTKHKIRVLVTNIRAKADTIGGQQKTWLRLKKDATIEELYRLFLDGQQSLVTGSPNADATELSQRRRAVFAFIYAAEGRTGIVARGSIAAEQMGYATKDQMREIQDRAVVLEQRIEPLIAYKSSADGFDKAIKELQESRGLFGLARAMRSRISGLLGRDSKSSFDSELALVMRDPYSPARWSSNPLYGQLGEQAIAAGALERVLIVSRLDGPTPNLVHQMIDTTVATERNGLNGNVYIDARGLGKDDGYVDYDRDLIRLANTLRTKSKLPVTLDRKSAVFQAGACPKSAIYCGWYNLESFVDAFEFVPGAVGYHIASFELVSLRDKSKRYWCKELLKDGVVATLGAVNEPYLEAFPKPTAFFGLLLTGEYTLGEVYAATHKLGSWQMTLIGDPLYNPFRNNPQMPTGWIPAWGN